jgi:hypothetical protein
LIFVSLLLEVLNPVLVVSTFYLDIVPLVFLIGGGVGLVAWIFFLLFLQQLALDLQRPGEAMAIRGLIIRSITLFLGVPLFLLLLGMFATVYAPFSTTVPRVLFGVSAVIILGQFVFVIMLFLNVLGNIQNLRDSIATQLRRREREEYP